MASSMAGSIDALPTANKGGNGPFGITPFGIAPFGIAPFGKGNSAARKFRATGFSVGTVKLAAPFRRPARA